ncbi:glycosyltransferase family 4 protein [Humibacillus xanthopallidus]|uniref:Glycosyltransferase involved in cell wall biosynthesis n=1 Tax=Humibacillus xanthopallidus TaxID=412689 RepID=A0A543I065_9MICO|nr:glycosyltransferase family 4 protein [Humibacillus xanthopallidus]TQM63982.1 glycosyltransferase involved in cell wall biosynthesis [Humibacillus xanthopallidus]
MSALPHLAHVPMPLAGDGSSVAHVVRALTHEHARRGGRSTVVTSHNREATYPDATMLPVDYTENCPRTHFTTAEYRQDWALGALLVERPHAARLFEPAARALAATAPDWVIVHEGHYAVTSLPLFRRMLPPRTRIALHLHNAISGSVLRPELTHLLRAADALVSVSAFMAEGVRRRAWFDEAKLITVPNGVDLERFPAVEREPRPQGAPLRLLFVGQVAPHKGVHLLLGALAAMGRHAEHLETRIVGSSELRESESLSDYERELRAIATSVRGSVTFEPYRSQAGVSELYRWADVVAVPSQAEPFGMVPLEAMASGALVLGNHSGALPEVLGQAGRLVEPTVAGWVDALTTLSRAQVEGARSAASARGRSFTWERSHTALLEGLQRLDATG